MEKTIQVNSLEEYKKSTIEFLHKKLYNYFGEEIFKNLSLEKINEQLPIINTYKNKLHLEPLDKSQVEILDDEKIDISEAQQCVLNGEFFWEHACAGEATRLGLGTKYLLNCHNFTKEYILDLISKEINVSNLKNPEQLFNDIQKNLIDPSEILPLSLGVRHILQMRYDIEKLANQFNQDPNKILEKQKMLIILNKKTASEIIFEFKEHNFFGFKEENVYFMVQEDFHGIQLINGSFQYDESDDKNKRLHNHGQMVMQKMHNHNIFHYINNAKVPISQQEYLDLLRECKDMISYNIEDIAYLTNSIDFPSLAKALELGSQGYNMIMEIVGQNPIRPQVGGAAFFDPILNKNVMVESHMLGKINPEDITFLNKNFNHFPNPHQSMEKLKEQSLQMPIRIKSAANNQPYFYFEPVQGDMNFLVKTAFIMRKEIKPIQNWKSPLTTPPTLLAMKAQDEQPKFKELAASLGFL